MDNVWSPRPASGSAPHGFPQSIAIPQKLWLPSTKHTANICPSALQALDHKTFLSRTFRSSHSYIYIYIYMCVWWQPAAKGHRAFTDLSAARAWGQSYMHSLQPCQLGNDSLLNMVPTPPLGRCVEGPPLVNHSTRPQGVQSLINDDFKRCPLCFWWNVVAI